MFCHPEQDIFTKVPFLPGEQNLAKTPTIPSSWGEYDVPLSLLLDPRLSITQLEAHPSFVRIFLFNTPFGKSTVTESLQYKPQRPVSL